MGRVVAVFDKKLGREVALKELLSGGQEASTSSQRLAREAWITAQLDHPGIVPVFDAGRAADGTLYYTMPVIRGRSLADALESATTDEARRALLPRVLAAAQAVAHAHEQGVIHRDLKPANIMVGSLGETQVVDWGLARSARAADDPWLAVLPSDTPTGPGSANSVLGPPQYMSPEQANSLPAGPQSDVWVLSIVAGTAWVRTTTERDRAIVAERDLRAALSRSDEALGRVLTE